VTIAALAMAPDVSWAVAVSADGTVRTLGTGSAPRVLRRAVPLDGQQVAVTLIAGRLIRVAWAAGDGLGLFESDRGAWPRNTVFAAPARITAVAFAPSGRIAMLACDDGTLLRLDVATGTFGERLTTGSSPAHALGLASDDGPVAICLRDGSVYRLDLRTGISQAVGTGLDVSTVAITPDGGILLTHGADGVLRRWDLSRNGMPRTQRLDQAVTGLAVDGTGDRVLTGGLDGALWLHDLTSGRVTPFGQADAAGPADEEPAEKEPPQAEPDAWAPAGWDEGAPQWQGEPDMVTAQPWPEPDQVTAKPWAEPVVAAAEPWPEPVVATAEPWPEPDLVSPEPRPEPDEATTEPRPELDEATAPPPDGAGVSPDLLVRTRRSDHHMQAGTTYRVGRDPTADIAFADTRVSWRHGLFRADGGQWVYEDAGSTNGTFLGAEQIDRITIDGDRVLRLGDPEDGPILRCMPQAPAAASPPAPDDPDTGATQVVPFEPPIAPIPAEPAVAPAPAEPAVPEDPAPDQGWYQEGGPQGYGAPADDGPGYGAPADDGPGYGAPEYGAQGYGAPGYGVQGYGAPEFGATGYGAPGYGSPEYGSPGYGPPGYGAPGYGAPEYGSPGYGQTGYGPPGSPAGPVPGQGPNGWRPAGAPQVRARSSRRAVVTVAVVAFVVAAVIAAVILTVVH
jgi:pSer/pThr/pTyr-binding forkhead associated (FHA) protein